MSPPPEPEGNEERRKTEGPCLLFPTQPWRGATAPADMTADERHRNTWEGRRRCVGLCKKKTSSGEREGRIASLFLLFCHSPVIHTKSGVRLTLTSVTYGTPGHSHPLYCRCKRRERQAQRPPTAAPSRATFPISAPGCHPESPLPLALRVNIHRGKRREGKGRVPGRLD